MLQIDIQIKNKCLELKNSGKSNREIYNEYFIQQHSGMNFETFRHKIKDWKKKMPNNATPIFNGKVSVEYKDTGDRIFEGIIELLEDEPITPEIVMLAHNLEPSKWHVISFKSNVWQSQVKGGHKIALWQSKITVRPKQDSEITFADIDCYYENKDWKAKPPVLPFKYDESKEILEIDYTDLHVGLLAWRQETGKDFDLNIVERMFKESIADIVRRCQHRHFKFIRFITLGDIIHIDNDEQKTTDGTFQQAEGRTPKLFNEAVDMIIDALDCLLELKTPIEYVYCCGNHDRTTGYFLAKSLQLAYRNNPNISFDIEPNPQKAKVYGNTLVGYCHGDMPRKNMGLWLLKNFRKEYGEARYCEIHSGHKHDKLEEEINGIKVVTLSSLCESSYWEHQQGYSSERALICYVWNEDTGKRETWVNNF